MFNDSKIIEIFVEQLMMMMKTNFLYTLLPVFNLLFLSYLYPSNTITEDSSNFIFSSVPGKRLQKISLSIIYLDFFVQEYNTNRFPWSKLVPSYGKSIVFVLMGKV